VGDLNINSDALSSELCGLPDVSCVYTCIYTWYFVEMKDIISKALE